MKQNILLSVLFMVISVNSIARDRDSLMRTLTDFEGIEKAIELNRLSAKSRDYDINKARYYAKEAVDYAKEIRTTKQEGIAYKNLGICDYYEGNYSSAFGWYQKALDVFNEVGYKEGIAKVCNNIAIVKNLQNEPQEAIDLYQQALNSALELKDSTLISQVYLNMGTVYDRLKNYNEALAYYNKALKFTNTLKNKTSSLSNIAAIHSTLKNYDLAIRIYNEALSIAKDYNDIWQQAKIKQNLANNWISKEDFDKAKLCIKKSLELSQGANLPEITANSYLLYANIYYREGRFERAIKYYNIAIEKYEILGLNEQANTAYRNISDCYFEIREYRKAFEYQKIYIARNDSIVRLTNRQMVSEMQEKYESEKKLNQIRKLEDENRKKELLNAEQKVVLEQERNLQLIIIFTALFIILIGIIIALISFKRQSEKKHEIESERTEVEQRLLRSQMNPHFIFNALSSIQSYIITNNTHDAGIFLSKFAMLVRNVLENSSESFISIDRELESLELYIDLERMRYNNTFTYEIINGLDDFYIKVPPMVMQPFVENAIIHGLRNKETKDGHLKIILKEVSDNAILCKVIDNGVGREKSADLQKDKKQHKSFATKLTKDRLERFSRKSQAVFEIQIVDLYDSNNIPEGTEVILTIPFK